MIQMEGKREALAVDCHGRYDALAVSAANGLVASGHFDPPVIRLFDARSGEPISVLLGHTAWVSSLAFSRDGRWLYSGAADQSICIWDVESGELLKRYRGHTDEVWSLGRSSDGSFKVQLGRSCKWLWVGEVGFGCWLNRKTVIPGNC